MCLCVLALVLTVFMGALLQAFVCVCSVFAFVCLCALLTCPPGLEQFHFSCTWTLPSETASEKKLNQLSLYCKGYMPCVPNH